MDLEELKERLRKEIERVKAQIGVVRQFKNESREYLRYETALRAELQAYEKVLSWLEEEAG